MLSTLKKIVFFRLGQKATKFAARSVGLKKSAPLIGLIGGIRTMRKH